MSENKKIVFIDRDGVINKDPGGWTKHNYVTRWEDFKFLPGSKEALKKLNDARYEIIIISNQAGVGKGHYSKDELDTVNSKMLEEIKKAGAGIRKVYYCIHRPDDNCDCRKPKIGLFKQAEEEMGIKAGGSYFIGDAKTDIEAGEKAGLKTILVLSGKTILEDMRSSNIKPDYIFDDIFEAVEFILNEATTYGGHRPT
ncbi:MAG: HAD-IIIA family hydrolase [Candidatus Omnitrophota bacterium]|nr:MAG: HAD-IIIA family hydrolase [Candidatus Omnitrophota bacterium]